MEDLRGRDPGRDVDLFIASDVIVDADARLVRVLLENLLENAWKYTSKTVAARIEVGVLPGPSEAVPTYYVRDNGAGFDMAKATKLFEPFQRFHGKEFAGTGIGLATVRRIVERHGGRAWAQAAVGQGAAVFFTLSPGRTVIAVSPAANPGA